MQTKNKSVVLLRRKLNYLVLFGLAVMGVCLYTLNFAITQKFGEITAQYTIFGALAICFGWGLLVSLLSAPILTSQFTGVIDRIKALKESRSKLVGLGYRKQDLIDSQIHDTEVAEKSVTEASRAMKVAIDKVLIATESTINAFMAGIGSRVVVFYGGLIDKLSPEAIRGVAYHEVAHAMNNDIFLTLFTLSFVNAFMFLGAICWEITKFLARWGWWFMTDEDKENGGRKINASKITGGITAGAVGGSAAAKFIAQFLNSDCRFWVLCSGILVCLKGCRTDGVFTHQPESRITCRCHSNRIWRRSGYGYGSPRTSRRSSRICEPRSKLENCCKFGYYSGELLILAIHPPFNATSHSKWSKHHCGQAREQRWTRNPYGPLPHHRLLARLDHHLPSRKRSNGARNTHSLHRADLFHLQQD